MREQIQQAIDLRDAVVTCFISGDGGELGCDVGRLYDLIDAALRRAKVEGMREAGKIARANAELLRPPSRQFELNMVNKAKSEEAGMIADEIDARAAQIEEGEHDDSHTSNG